MAACLNCQSPIVDRKTILKIVFYRPEAYFSNRTEGRSASADRRQLNRTDLASNSTVSGSDNGKRLGAT